MSQAVIAFLSPWVHNLHLPDGSQTASDHVLRAGRGTSLFTVVERYKQYFHSGAAAVKQTTEND
jgi:hypothetical protein